MKLRIGFVSNSSSCSFLIYGTTVSNEDIENVPSNWDNNNDCDPIERLEELLKDTELMYFTPEDSEIYIGCNWDSIGDHQTGLEFKNSIKEDLKKVFGKDMECGSHEETWYN